MSQPPERRRRERTERSTRTAVITASYAKDLERCRLLCDSLDHRLQGHWNHYILVEAGDLARFSALSGPRRHIVDEREVLPNWLRPFPDPVSLARRRVWLSPFTPPLRGWHVQQLRRLGMGRMLEEETIFSADSDVVLVRDFDPADLWQEGRMRLYRRENGVSAAMQKHVAWVRRANRLLGCADETDAPYHDYISTLIGWRSDTLRGLLDHIEAVRGVGWVRAVAANRSISECTLYGVYVDRVLSTGGHFHCDKPLCRVMWFGPERHAQKQSLSSFLNGMEPGQVGIGIQSFIDYDLDEIRRVVLSDQIGCGAAPRKAG